MAGSVPLLFLGVDGPLIPFGSPHPYPTYETGRLEHAGSGSHPLLPRLNPAHGPRLTALPCELVWATSWMADANDRIAPRLGLPELAVVAWPDPSDADERDARNGLHWKTRTLVAWAAGRPFAWVDDEISDADRAWVAAHHRGRGLLHRVDARVGLGEGDYRVLEEWLREVRGAV
ncbi:hypothetical protein [Actinomadura sp. NPDC048394]|uniref:hypothetical protein n=1 Tax=Actinomadura sp. NPDC048394 TaxID=3158223 RepID=UPI0033D117BA